MIRSTPTLLTNKLILGVDPGTTIMGYALIEVTGAKVKVLTYDTINLKRVTNHAVKLKRIYDGTIELINQYLPDEMAIEAQFYSNNVQSMLKLGRAQGVAIAAALSRDIPYVEYAPKRIKQSITGNGNASKEQVAHMLNQTLKLPDLPKLFDATDALAVAMCHHYQKGVNTQAGTKSWKSFLTDNPDRIK
ncbi:crossover junction endodeoxyribonuclease RuvC [Adhaeribacter aerolatus]|uniref:Crossover junction endodeoxyribonuclease RuvC n=1 Tax=Adhaeribacter aerolatus TaxID=670289 RepID=A0A512AWH9_9BACT|nr:crossover junction endodeoxyribonuclease RuvC [Adhaeribacter aerolatus]GEO04079.1 crossover junction endodeoxyribonuclease RuvC [Adhaeribacter aerolatus]